jgi:hypothetical protein
MGKIHKNASQGVTVVLEAWWLTPVISATWEADMGKSEVPDSPSKKLAIPHLNKQPK